MTLFEGFVDTIGQAARDYFSFFFFHGIHVSLLRLFITLLAFQIYRQVRSHSHANSVSKLGKS